MFDTDVAYMVSKNIFAKVIILVFIYSVISRAACSISKITENKDYEFQCGGETVQVSCDEQDKSNCTFLVNANLRKFSSKFVDGKIESITLLSKTNAEQKQCLVSDKDKNLKCSIENNCQKEKENLNEAIQTTELSLPKKCDGGCKVSLSEFASYNRDLINKSCSEQEEVSKNKEKMYKTSKKF